MASLNKVILMGNITADLELKTTQSGVSVIQFSIAVGRRFAKETDEVKADFINIVAWRNTAEFISKYFSKGKSIVVVGSLQVRSYTAQDGSKRYVTEVVADEVTFGAGASENGAAKKGDVRADDNKHAVADANFEEIGSEEVLPF